MFKEKLPSKYNIFLTIIGISFFIGIWYAFPMLDVVADENYFTGSVLRSIQNHTIIPAMGDVPYGVITYLVNYILIAFSLIGFLLFFKFDVSALKDYLIQSPEFIYIFPRLLSAMLGIVILFTLNNFLKKEVEDIKSKILLLTVTFTNMLTVFMLHTGKVWILSMTFLTISFYYLYKAIEYNQTPKYNINKYIFISILCSLLATINFSLFGFSLINILILLYLFRKNKQIQKSIIKYSFLAGLITAIFASLTFKDITKLLVDVFTFMNPVLDKNIVDTRINLGIPEEMWLNIKKILAFFPIHIILILLSIKNKIKNKKLFILSIIYFIVYFLFISSIATWPTKIEAFARYMFPFGFLLTFILMSLNIKFTKLHYTLGGISIIYFIFAMTFISIPTSYNLTRDWIIENLNQDKTIVVNKIHGLELPKNKDSYYTYQDYYCATKCKNTIKNNINNHIKYITIDLHSKKEDYESSYTNIYYITKEKSTESNLNLIKSFAEDGIDNFELDGRMGNYFDLDFFRIKMFGPDIYIYKKI